MKHLVVNAVTMVTVLSFFIPRYSKGRHEDALSLSFSLLDHPSWAYFDEPWRLLRRSIRVIGKKRYVLALIRLNYVHFVLRLPGLCTAHSIMSV